jgi:signal transduction histidine kinase
MGIDVRAASPTCENPHLGESLAELDALVTFLQADSERKSSSVARKLHDDLGGCVIGAMMDVAWIAQHDSQLPADTVMRLARVNDGLRGAIDVTRKIVEELRPTLLDSIGLFAALSWQFKRGCTQAGIAFVESYPESAPEMDAARLIALFRIAQESFNVALQRESVSALTLTVTANDNALTIQLADDGKASATDAAADPLPAPMLAILHRVRGLKGEVVTTPRNEGGSVLRITVPVA